MFRMTGRKALKQEANTLCHRIRAGALGDIRGEGGGFLRPLGRAWRGAQVLGERPIDCCANDVLPKAGGRRARP